VRIVLIILAVVGYASAQNPALKFATPINLGPPINTPGFDGGPSLSADGLTLYLASNRPGGVGGDDLWVSSRTSTRDAWQSPVNLGPTINSAEGDASPSISADGLELYFDSARPGGQGSGDLWVTARASASDAWGTPRNLGPSVNSSSADSVPKLSSDGRSLFFASARPGGLGMRDVWAVTRTSRAEPWQAPINLGAAVNSPAHEWGPGISPNGLMLIIQSDRAGGLGGDDLWVTTRATSSSTWTAVSHLGAGINTRDVEAKPEFSADGSTLLFMSTRPGGEGSFDIWEVSIVGSRQESGRRSAVSGKPARSQPGLQR
jgi:Tol biopolymer transport system component